VQRIRGHKVTNVDPQPFGDGDYQETRYLVDGVWHMGDIEGMRRVLVSAPRGEAKVVVPDFVRALSSVDAEPGAFEGYEGLQEVVLPDSLEYIGWWAFAGCKDLVKVIIPSSVQRICQQAFFGCTSLREIGPLNDTIEIENTAFAGCASLPEPTRARIKAINPTAYFTLTPPHPNTNNWSNQ
jgi:hypothetical protein